MIVILAFLEFSLLGIIEACQNTLDYDCDFVNSCMLTNTNNNSAISHNDMIETETDQNAAIGYGRWGTRKPCNGHDYKCHWEKPQNIIGDAFSMADGAILIHTTGFYRIDVALFNDRAEKWIGVDLKKNGIVISAG